AAATVLAGDSDAPATRSRSQARQSGRAVRVARASSPSSCGRRGNATALAAAPCASLEMEKKSGRMTTSSLTLAYRTDHAPRTRLRSAHPPGTQLRRGLRRHRRAASHAAPAGESAATDDGLGSAVLAGAQRLRAAGGAARTAAAVRR